ncbi:MAG: hypothetical protein WCO45_13570 [Pseudanabaena sp. ELA607]|jgi:hypothetical protein
MQSYTSNITLIVFACEGREHLLPATIESLRKSCDYLFNPVILAIDGDYSNEAITVVKPDLIVQNYDRKGYVQNIINALNLIETEFFFWLEDDWEFTKPVDLNYLLDLLRKNPDWVQIRLSKTAPLTNDEKAINLFDDIYGSIYGFSANPCVCRTELVKLGLKALQEAEKDKYTGFETFLSEWYAAQKLTCAVLDPKDSVPIIHSGYLESTPRQWHMTASLDEKTNEYLSPMGHIPEPSFLRRLLMFFRLLSASLSLSIRQFWSRSSYDLSFRILSVIKESRKN